MGIIATLLLLIALLHVSFANVVELSEKSFGSAVLKTQDPWIVFFGTSWCGHCQRFTPEYHNAASKLHPMAKFGHVDCDKESALCQRYDVKGYPTVKLFLAPSKEGGKKVPEDYQGARDAKSVASTLVARIAKNVAVLKDSQQQQKFLDSSTSSEKCLMVAGESQVQEKKKSKAPLSMRVFNRRHASDMQLAQTSSSPLPELSAGLLCAHTPGAGEDYRWEVIYDASANGMEWHYSQIHGNFESFMGRGDSSKSSASEAEEKENEKERKEEKEEPIRHLLIKEAIMLQTMEDTLGHCENHFCVLLLTDSMMHPADPSQAITPFVEMLGKVEEKHRAAGLFRYGWIDSSQHLNIAPFLQATNIPSLVLVSLKKEFVVPFVGGLNEKDISQWMQRVLRNSVTNIYPLPHTSIPFTAGGNVRDPFEPFVLPEEEDYDLSDVELANEDL